MNRNDIICCNIIMANVSDDVIKNEVYDEEHNVESDLDISDIEDDTAGEDDDTEDDVEDSVDESGSSDETDNSASDKEAEDDAQVKRASTFADILEKGLELDESYMTSLNIFVSVFILVLITPVLFLDPEYGNIMLCLSMTALALAYNNIYTTPSISDTNLKLD
jgi:hypothetical protein